MGQNESRNGKPQGSYNSKFTNERTRSSRVEMGDRQIDSRKEVLKSTVASQQPQKQNQGSSSTNPEPTRSGQNLANLNQQENSITDLSNEPMFQKFEFGKSSQLYHESQNTSKIDDSISCKQTLPVQELSFSNSSILELTKNEVLTPLSLRDASTVQELNSNSYLTSHHQIDTTTTADLSDVGHQPDPTSTYMEPSTLIMQTQDEKVSTTVSRDISHFPSSTCDVLPKNNISVPDVNSFLKAKLDTEITDNDDLSPSASNDTLLTLSVEDALPTKEFFIGNPLFIQTNPKISAGEDKPSSSKIYTRKLEQNFQSKNKMNQNFNSKQNISKIIGTKGHCTKTSSTTKALKHFEQLADKLSGLNINHDAVTKRSRPGHTKLFNIEKSPTTENFISGSCSKIPIDECITQVKNISGSCSKIPIDECIIQVKNINANNGEFDPFLQQAILEHLQNINTLISVLKSHPILETKIATQISVLRENVLSLAAGEVKNFEFDFKVQLSNSTIKFTNPFPDNNYISNKVVQDISKPSFEISEIVDNETSEGQQTISIHSFKSLLDKLAYEFEEDKPYISLQGAQLYCRICEKPITFELFNLEEHLRGKKHKAVLVESKVTSVESVNNLINKDACENSALPGAITYNNEKLPPNYEGALDIINQSHENDLVVPFTMFVCRPCDFLTNKEEDAMAHLNESTHVNQQLLDAKWHICNSCCLHIYGTDNHIGEHCLTRQHINVLILQTNKETSEMMMDKHEQEQKSSFEADQASISSSTSDLSIRKRNLKPHEILLVISKDRLLQKDYSYIGSFCQICNKYTLYNKTKLDHFQSETHIEILKTKNINKLNKHYCSSCRVHIFGNENILTEHIALSLHQEISTLVENNVDNLQTVAGSDMDEQMSSEEWSDDSGPHYELMKKVLKKHINFEQTTHLFGFYCHICKYCSNQKTRWEAHLKSASHSNRINSAECAKKKNMFHSCEVCNIYLICDDAVLSLHTRCFAHKAILKKQQANSQHQELLKEYKEQVSQKHCNEEQENEEALSEDTDSSEEEGVNDSQSTSSSVANGNKQEVLQKKRIIKSGVYVKGLSPNTEQKDVFEAFKKYGFIKKCNIDQKLHTATVEFHKIAEANNVLNKKEFYIRNTPVMLCPLLGADVQQKRRRGKRSISTDVERSLPSDVVSAMQSPICLQRLLAGLEAELQEEAKVWSQKSSLIRNDIFQAVGNCRILFFGSRETGLATKNSDCDIFIFFDPNSYNKEVSQKGQQEIIDRLLQIFTQPRSRFRVIEPVVDARVPIIRVFHNRTEIPCDISCRSGISVENSNLIRCYVDSDSRVHELVILVKWWMKANNLLDRYIFTSYTTTWMVLFFLMQTYTLKKPVLCPVSHLQKNCPPKFISYWDCRFSRVEERFRTANRQPVLELLNLFFWFYGDLTYKDIVLCPLTGSMIQRKNFEQLNLSQEYAPYVRRLKTDPHAEILRTATPICIQDPFDLSHNISKGVGGKDLKTFKTLCHQSAAITGRVGYT